MHPACLVPSIWRVLIPKFTQSKSEDVEGMRAFFRDFSFPGGIGSDCTPETPGSIHEGGELGYSVSTFSGRRLTIPTCWSRS